MGIEKYEKKETGMDQHLFTNLMLAAVGNRTKKEFSEIIGISPEYFSRLINRSNSIIPSKSLLVKVAEASKSPVVTKDALFKACGYEVDKTSLSISEIGTEMVASLHKWFDESKNIVLCCNSLDDANESIVSTLDLHFNTLSFSDYPVSFEVIDLINTPCKGFKHEAYIGMRMIFEECTIKNSGCMEAHVFFILAGHWSMEHNFYVEELLTSGEDVAQFRLIPDSMMDAFNENGINLNDLDNVVICLENIERKKAMERAASKLLDCIFGTNRQRYVTLCEGYGFYLEKMPENFLEFSLKHFDSWMSDESDDSKRNYVRQSLQTLVDESTNGISDELEHIIDDFFKDSYCVVWNPCSNGWPNVIAKTIAKESGIANIEYWRPHKKDDDVHDYGNKDTIMLLDDYLEQLPGEYSDNKTMVKDVFIKYAKELGIKQVEHCYYELEFDVNDADRDVTEV